MKTVSINFRTKSVDVLSSNFIALNVGQPIKSSKNINLRCSTVNDEVPVAAPVAFNGQTLLNHQGFYFAVFPSVGGRQFEADNIDQTEAVGRYLGRMHQTGHKQLLSIARPSV